MARELAQRSLCDRDKVGALICDENNKVIGEGYNGPPKGFWHGHQPCVKWCARAATAQWKAGEAPYTNAADFPEWARAGFYGPNKDYSDCPSLHAEANALITSDRTLRAGGTIYVTSHVCMACAKLIANSGLRCVIVATNDEERGYRQPGDSYDFLATCAIAVYVNDERWIKK